MAISFSINKYIHYIIGGLMRYLGYLYFSILCLGSYTATIKPTDAPVASAVSLDVLLNDFVTQLERATDSNDMRTVQKSLAEALQKADVSQSDYCFARLAPSLEYKISPVQMVSYVVVFGFLKLSRLEDKSRCYDFLFQAMALPELKQLPYIAIATFAIFNDYNITELYDWFAAQVRADSNFEAVNFSISGLVYLVKDNRVAVSSLELLSAYMQKAPVSSLASYACFAAIAGFHPHLALQCAEKSIEIINKSSFLSNSDTLMVVQALVDIAMRSTDARKRVQGYLQDIARWSFEVPDPVVAALTKLQRCELSEMD
jgi:hypothetical protein